jgi:hypothetical protein
VTLERLDFIYMPSPDTAADVRHFESALDAEVVFAIERFGTRVAMVKLAEGSPALLFAQHLGGERPVLVYRVGDFDSSVRELVEQGCEVGQPFEIPHGPCCEIHSPGGNRLAIYELARPETAARIAGRRDF